MNNMGFRGVIQYSLVENDPRLREPTASIPGVLLHPDDKGS